jgi:predicted enzyme related to lactoylglutathione lyase
MAGNKTPQGTFVWNELVTLDVDAARKFYTELIGWDAKDSGMPGLKYIIFNAGDKGAAGLMEMPPDAKKGGVPSHWMAYIAVDDVDASAAKAKELGGKILHGPEDVPDVGRFCIIQDPTGAVVSLMTMKE